MTSGFRSKAAPVNHWRNRPSSRLQMTLDLNAMSACLEHLEAMLSYRYAQWLVEDLVTWDYRVVAERIPAGGEGYPVAHRTGVIGQGFRTRRAIIVPDARSHPLYDPFDPRIDWEVAIPVWRGESLAALLNVEGSGSLALHGNQWNAGADLVSDTTGWSMQASPPDPTALVAVKTRRAIFSARTGERDVLEAAKRLADRGSTGLVIGAFAEVVRSDNHSVCEAEARRLPLASCVCGIAQRLDILPLGSAADSMRTFERLGGWKLVDGRYEFVFIAE